MDGILTSCTMLHALRFMIILLDYDIIYHYGTQAPVWARLYVHTIGDCTPRSLCSATSYLGQIKAS